MNVLRQLTLDHGTDPCCWTADGRREAVAELFAQDEKLGKHANWIGDCFSEFIASIASERLALIEALRHDNAAMRHAALGIMLERALVNFPLDHLQSLAEEHEAEWLAQDQEQALADDREQLVAGSAGGTAP